MTPRVPDIVRLSERILLEVERAVVNFPKRHRYGESAGGELRRSARDVVRATQHAWRAHHDRGPAIAALSAAIDALKVELQLCQSLGAFSSFGVFETLITLAQDIGRRCGGWQRKHPIGQSRTAYVPPGSASLLSARDASQGANP
jgi:hypothetical protein